MFFRVNLEMTGDLVAAFSSKIKAFTLISFLNTAVAAVVKTTLGSDMTLSIYPADDLVTKEDIISAMAHLNKSFQIIPCPARAGNMTSPCCFADIDECARNTDTCTGNHTVCRNKKGGYACECEEGYDLSDDYICEGRHITVTSQERHGVSNHQQFHFFHQLIQVNSDEKRLSCVLVTLCDGNPLKTGRFPSLTATNVESVFISWCHSNPEKCVHGFIVHCSCGDISPNLSRPRCVYVANINLNLSDGVYDLCYL